jgi:hypothetical protein
MSPLTDDEFRLLAFMRGYAERVEQHLDPSWIQEQLEFSPPQMQAAARGLAARGLAEVFEWSPSNFDFVQHPEISKGMYMSDIRLTPHGWDYLRAPEA